MEDLIKALRIFMKYGNPGNPTCCEHDKLVVMIDPRLVSQQDKKLLEGLSFYPDVDGDEELEGREPFSFYSNRFGSV